MLQIERVGHTYFEQLCKDHNDLADAADKAMVRAMIEVWNLFDAAYLSRNRAEVIMKLHRLINYIYGNPQQLWTQLEMKFQNGQDYGDELVQLVGLGDFHNVYHKITTNSNFNQQDIFLHGLAKNIHDLARMFCQVELGRDVDINVFKKEQEDRINQCRKYIDTVNGGLGNRSNFHKSLVPLARLMAGDKTIIHSFKDYLQQAALTMLFVTIPDDNSISDVI